MDCYCKNESKEEVTKFLDTFDRENLGKQFRQSIFPAERPEKWPDILSKLQWEMQKDSEQAEGAAAGAGMQSTALATTGSITLGMKKFRGCSKLDQFNAEQNLECMIAADEYYSKQRLEPFGSCGTVGCLFGIYFASAWGRGA